VILVTSHATNPRHPTSNLTRSVPHGCPHPDE
jgi:hypothetical protein